MAKCLLGVLFILSAVLKFISIDAFERYLFSFTLFSFNFCSFAARLVIAAESLIGFAFILNYRHKLLCRITAVVLAVFSCFLLYLVFVGNEENCHCFGEVIDMRPEESLSKNVGLAILLAVVWRYSGKKEILSRWLAHIVFVAVFIAPLYVLAGGAKIWYNRYIVPLPIPCTYRRVSTWCAYTVCIARFAKRLHRRLLR